MKKVILILLCCIGCCTDNVHAIRTILCGHFTYQPEATVTLMYYNTPVDDVESNKTTKEVTVDKDNKFFIEIDIDEPKMINVINGTKWMFYNKFISTGDSIHMVLKENSIDIDGKGGDAISAMFMADNLFGGSEDGNSYTPLEYAAVVNKKYAEQLAFYDSVYKGSDVPTTYKKAVATEVTYHDYAVKLVQYSWRKKGEEKVFTDSAYNKYLSNIPANDEKDLVSNGYVFYLRELPYALWKSTVDMKNLSDPRYKYNFDNRLRLRDSIAKRYFTGKVYDIALYWILYEGINNLNSFKGTKGFDSIYNNMQQSVATLGASFNDKSYLDRLRDKMTAIKNTNMPATDITAMDMDGKEVKLSDFKGKVVYVDFWATNCAPCVAEIEGMKKLHEKYKDKDIIFMCVSFDNSKEFLAQFLKERSYDGVQLIETKGLSSKSAQDYKIAGIPRYLLVDKKGNLISDNAPRPSSHPEEMIDKALEQK